MTPIEELDLLLTLIRKYDLPLSPILEYAVTEKKDENGANLPVEETGREDFADVSDSTIETESASISIVDFDIPENADTTTRNKYLMQFCYGILSEFRDALDDREKDICNMLLVENARYRASKECHVTEERVRQIYVKSIKKISHAHKAAMQELEELRKENEELKRRNYLLEMEMKNAANFDNVLSLQKLEDSLCYNAKRLLAFPNKELPFSNRTLNILKAAKVEYFKDIPQLTLEQVHKFRNCGRKTITELRDFMFRYSLDFGMTYEDIIARMSTLVDGDFDPSLFACQNLHSLVEQVSTDEEIVQDDVIIEGRDDNVGDTDKNIVEHVFLDSKGEIKGATSLSICPENRCGMPWSSEEEKLVSNYYNQGQSFSAIARAIGRTEVAVMSRLGMMGVIDYTYGQDYKPKETETSSDVDENEEEQEFNGRELAERYYYPIQDSLFWDEDKKRVYEIYLADSYELILNHLIFDFDRLNEIEIKSEGLTEDEKEDLFTDYWYDNHINIIARIKPESEGFELLQFETGPGIKNVVYKAGEYTYIRITDEDDGLDKFIDYNGAVFDSPDPIMAATNSEVAKYHNFYDAPKYITKEFLRFGMIEIKRIYKGTVKKVTIYVDSELGQVIKENSEEIWMLDKKTIITKSLRDEDNAYPLKVYFCNGVKMNDAGLEAVKTKSLALQTQLLERIKKLQASLKKKKEKIRFERQFKEIVSTLFCFDDESNEKEDSTSDNNE